MSLIARLFVREFLPIFVLSWGLFSGLSWLVFFLSGIFTFLSSALSLSQYSGIELKQLPFFIDLTLSLAWLFALTGAVIKFKERNEWVAIWGAGVSTSRLIVPYLGIALFLGVLSLVWQDKVVIPAQDHREVERVTLLGLVPQRREILLVDPQKRTLLWAVNFHSLTQILEQPLFLQFLPTGELVLSVSASQAFLSEEGQWVFRAARVWSWRGSHASEMTYSRLEVTGLCESLLSLSLARGDWHRSSLEELLVTRARILSNNQKVPIGLSAQILLRLTGALRFVIMTFWAWGCALKFPSSSFLLTLLSSLSFNLVYTILHLVLLAISASAIVLPFVAGALELIFWAGVLGLLWRKGR